MNLSRFCSILPIDLVVMRFNQLISWSCGLEDKDLSSYYELWRWFDLWQRRNFRSVYGIVAYSEFRRIWLIFSSISGLERQQQLEDSLYWPGFIPSLDGWSFHSVFWELDVKKIVGQYKLKQLTIMRYWCLDLQHVFNLDDLILFLQKLIIIEIYIK